MFLITVFLSKQTLLRLFCRKSHFVLVNYWQWSQNQLIYLSDRFQCLSDVSIAAKGTFMIEINWIHTFYLMIPLHILQASRNVIEEHLWSVHFELTWRKILVMKMRFQNPKFLNRLDKLTGAFFLSQLIFCNFVWDKYFHHISCCIANLV